MVVVPLHVPCTDVGTRFYRLLQQYLRHPCGVASFPEAATAFSYSKLVVYTGVTC